MAENVPPIKERIRSLLVKGLGILLTLFLIVMALAIVRDAVNGRLSICD